MAMRSLVPLLSRSSPSFSSLSPDRREGCGAMSERSVRARRGRHRPDPRTKRGARAPSATPCAEAEQIVWREVGTSEADPGDNVD